MEKLFLHYATGFLSVSGQVKRSYLAVNDKSLTRKIIVNGYKFLNWSKPNSVSKTAAKYLDRRWLLIDIIATKTQYISDCEKIRNRIAHISIEANSDFAGVQRNLFQTERLFEMTPGHLLRTRFRGRRKILAQHYNEVLSEMLLAISDPPQ